MLCAGAQNCQFPTNLLDQNCRFRNCKMFSGVGRRTKWFLLACYRCGPGFKWACFGSRWGQLSFCYVFLSAGVQRNLNVLVGWGLCSGSSDLHMMVSCSTILINWICGSCWGHPICPSEQYRFWWMLCCSSAKLEYGSLGCLLQKYGGGISFKYSPLLWLVGGLWSLTRLVFSLLCL